MKLIQKGIYHMRVSSIKEALNGYNHRKISISDEIVESFKDLSEWLSVNASGDDFELIRKHIGLGNRAADATLEHHGLGSDRAVERYKNVITGFKSIAVTFPEHKEKCIEFIHTAINRSGPNTTQVHGEAKHFAVETLRALGQTDFDEYLKIWAEAHEYNQTTSSETFVSLVQHSQNPEAAMKILADAIAPYGITDDKPPVPMEAYLELVELDPSAYKVNASDCMETIIKHLCNPPYSHAWRAVSDIRKQNMELSILYSAQDNTDILRISGKIIQNQKSLKSSEMSMEGLESLEMCSSLLNGSYNIRKIEEILARQGKIPALFQDREARIKGKTLEEQEAQDLFVVKAVLGATSRILDKTSDEPQAKDGPLEAAHQFIEVIVYTGDKSPFPAVKQLVLDNLSKNKERLGNYEEMLTGIALTTTNVEILNQVLDNLTASLKVGGKLETSNMRLLQKISDNVPEHAHFMAQSFDKIMRTELVKAQEGQDSNAKHNVRIVQKALINIQSPTAVQIIQKCIRSGYAIGQNEYNLTPSAADNLHNAYAQLIENGKLSGEKLSSAYVLLANISDQYPQYMPDSFQLAQQRLLQQRVPDPYQINHGALTAMQIIGSNKNFALKSFDVLADLMGQSVQESISVTHALTTVVQDAPFLAPKAFEVFKNYLADNLDMDEELSEDAFSSLVIIAIGNEETALDIIDLLEQEHTRNPAAAQTAIKEIIQHYPLYKNKEMSIELN